MFEFERGPVHLAYESTNTATPPSDQCFGEAASEILALYMIYVDDRAMAENLSLHYGAPVRYATFETQASALGPPTQETWTMDVENGGSTSITFTSMAVDALDGQFTTRYAYGHKDGIAMMQDTLHDFTDAGNPPLASGNMAAPTVWHDYVGLEQYAGPASYSQAIEWTGEFVFFEDAYCKVPN